MKKLEHYGGQGYKWSKPKGFYKVITNEKDFDFTELEQAKVFYESLNEDKEIWDYNTSPLLISAHFLK